MARLIDISDVLPSIAERGLKETLEAIEYSAIVYALKQTGNEFTLAAEFLGMKRTTLVEARKRYGMRVRQRNSGRWGKLEYRKKA